VGEVFSLHLLRDLCGLLFKPSIWEQMVGKVAKEVKDLARVGGIPAGARSTVAAFWGC
jgi:hypothetical protein